MAGQEPCAVSRLGAEVAPAVIVTEIVKKYPHTWMLLPCLEIMRKPGGGR